MTLQLRYTSIGIVATLLFVTAFAVFNVAKANPSFFIRSNTATGCFITASTSVAYMTPGTATTTTTFDTSCAGAGSVDGAALAIQFNASSTNSRLNVNIEYSQDGNDWYSDAPTNPSDYATTTLPVSLTPIPQYQWQYASSTIGGVAIQNAPVGTLGTNRDTRILTIKTPTKYVRAIYSLNIGGTNGAVWSEFIAKRQNP